MADLRGFDANDVEPNAGFEAIPTGQYLAVITESEMKPTKSNQGYYLQLTFEVIEGEYAGRKVWARLNLENPNETAVAIARGDLSAICRAVGVLTPNDSDELHDIPLLIKVVAKKRQDTGELTNEIKGYADPKKAEKPTAKEPAKTAATSAAKEPAKVAPWKKSSAS